MVKKWMGILFIVVYLCFGIIDYRTLAKDTDSSQPIVSGKPDIVITDYSINSTSVRKDDIFRISNIKIKNISGSLLSNVYMLIDEDKISSYVVESSNPVIRIKDIPDTDSELSVFDNQADGQNMKYITLRYNGGENIKLPVTFYYRKGNDQASTSTYISINAIPESTIPKPDPVDTTKLIPKIGVLNNSIPTGSAGGTVTIPLSIKNSSSYEARNVVIIPQLSKVSDTPFEADTINSSQAIPRIGANSSEFVTFNLRISDMAAGKTYPIELDFEFENVYGNSFTSSGVIYVKVNAKEGSSKLIVKDLYYSNPVILPGEGTDLNISIINTGSFPANDIRVSLQGLKEDGFTLFNGANNKYIDKLNAGESTSVTYNLAVSKKMEKGNYGLTIKIEYKDYAGKDCSEEQQFFLPVQGEDKVVKTVPKIILDQYNCSPSIVKAGQNFQLNLSFLNTSDSKEVRNIKISLDIEKGEKGGNVFTPINSSNTMFIDKIAPKGRVSKSLTLFTIPDASAKTYALTANFEYEDSEGNPYTSTELIGIPVKQQTKLETTEISMPPESYPGQPFPVGFDFYNMGKVVLGNLMIKVEGDFDLQNPSYFVGNFEPGSSDHFESMIIPRAPGTANGKIVISYDDPSGEHVEEVKDFALNVIEMPKQQIPPGGEKPGMPVEGVKQGGIKKLIKSPFLWGGALLAAAAVVFIIFKIRKKKGGIELDE